MIFEKVESFAVKTPLDQERLSNFEKITEPAFQRFQCPHLEHLTIALLLESYVFEQELTSKCSSSIHELASLSS